MQGDEPRKRAGRNSRTTPPFLTQQTPAHAARSPGHVGVLRFENGAGAAVLQQKHFLSVHRDGEEGASNDDPTNEQPPR